ncbi:PqiC family protein [Congregibacter variabilis]|uniref:PqiC family protein n=1 Tax=Congregibacter variabilis TaxID=3081200 RepID=A0ABZ0I410_9GAMM|nr:PqiC family protein [Congregibacter sp. IMCC43200]
MIRKALALTAAIYLFGCAASSQQIQHLQLSAGDAPAPQGDKPVIVLESIEVPDFLLRDELLHRQSDFTIRYNSTRRWAEPLDLGIQRVIGRRLQTALDTQRVVLFPDAPSTPADWQLRVTITHFEATGPNVKIAAQGRWERQNQDTLTVESVVFEDSQQLSSGSGEDIARTMSELLWRFADELAAAIPNPPALSANGSPNTPAIEIETTKP